MTKPSKCKECSGAGRYLVFNAYDPTFSEEVTCEYCVSSKKKPTGKKGPVPISYN